MQTTSPFCDTPLPPRDFLFGGFKDGTPLNLITVH